jgi:iron complex outermembrane receptor protein
MTNNRPKYSALALAVAATVGGMYTAPVLAEGLQLEEVVVTARKREESLSDVPAAITAFSGEQLRNAGFSKATDLDTIAPNMVFDQVTAGSTASSGISLRGVSFQDVEKSFDPAIGVQMDGLYMGTSNGQIFRLLDVERIEVIRGPQGTLFGKNTIGGLINVIRSKPTGEFGGKVRVGVGRFGEKNIDALLNVGNETLAAKFVYGMHKTDGYFDNLVTGEEAGEADVSTATINVLWRPTDTLSLDVLYNRVDDESDTPPLANVSLDFTNPNGAGGSLLTCTGADALAVPRFGFCAANADTTQTGDRYVVNQNGSDENFFDMDTFRLQAEWEINDALTAIYVGGIIETEEEQNQDFDATPVTIYHAIRASEYEQMSHELRLQGDMDKLSYVAGVYLWHSEYQQSQSDVFFAPLPSLDTDYEADSWSFFFEGDYQLTDQLAVTLGARYVDEEKTLSISGNGGLPTAFSTFPGGRMADGSDPATSGAPASNFTGPQSSSWDDTIYRIALKYDWNDSVNTYLSYSTGFRSGGYNGRGASFLPATEAYDPETVSSLEVGLKAELMDGRMSLNIAAFTSDYDDKQEEINVADPSSGTGQSTVVRNAAKASIQGLEVEWNMLLTEGWTVGAFLGLLDAEFDSFQANLGYGERDNSDLKLRRVPETSFGVHTTYQTDIGKGEATFSMNYGWKDDYEIANATNEVQGHIDAHGILNIGADYEIGPIKISAYGRNMSDEDVYTHAFVVAPGPANLFAFATPREPRNYGLEVTYSF